MSGRTLYIEDAEPAAPCVCSNCEWKGAAVLLLPATDGSLTPGDPSFAGRCPDCDSVAYLDRPKDQAMDALNHLIWTLGQGYPVGDANLLRAADKLAKALSDAPGGLTATITFN